MGNPTHDPHGDPIPTRELKIEERQTTSLRSLCPGDKGRFTRVSDSDPEMLRYLGWTEAADLTLKGITETIRRKTVTYDLERLMEGAKKVRCSEFGDLVIENMDR